MMELFSLWEMEGRADETSVKDISELTKNLALMVIGAAGELSYMSNVYLLSIHSAFGMEMSWKDDGTLPLGHAMVSNATFC